jgi:hypothetical protein
VRVPAAQLIAYVPIVQPAPALPAFTLQYRDEEPAYDDLDAYLRSEFQERHPEWEPTFGRATSLEGSLQRPDFAFLVIGNVPHADTQEAAERNLRHLFDAIADEVTR